MEDCTVTFDSFTDLDAKSPTLIEGFPGYGLVAAIAVDQITKQLGLEHHGNLVSEEFPPVLSYQNGRARDTVRVYGGTTPPVMTLQSDLAFPPTAYKPLSQCVHEQLAEEFDRAIFLAGVPAQREADLGTVKAIATTPALETEVRNAGIELAEEAGLVGGITGALANDCYHNDVPAVVLLVQADPYLPDPGAAQSVIEHALEPLVEFDIDTSPLEEQAAQIRQQLQQIATQYQQLVEQQQQQPQPDPSQIGMYQ